MTEGRKSIRQCPNCGKPAIYAGNEIACEQCDSIFTVTEKQAAKVKSIGIEERLKKCEDKLFPPEPKDEPKDEPKSDEGDEL